MQCPWHGQSPGPPSDSRSGGKESSSWTDTASGCPRTHERGLPGTPPTSHERHHGLVALHGVTASRVSTDTVPGSLLQSQVASSGRRGTPQTWDTARREGDGVLVGGGGRAHSSSSSARQHTPLHSRWRLLLEDSSRWSRSRHIDIQSGVGQGSVSRLGRGSLSNGSYCLSGYERSGLTSRKAVGSGSGLGLLGVGSGDWVLLVVCGILVVRGDGRLSSLVDRHRKSGQGLRRAGERLWVCRVRGGGCGLRGGLGR